jgi:hypothetical protein
MTDFVTDFLIPKTLMQDHHLSPRSPKRPLVPFILVQHEWVLRLE